MSAEVLARLREERDQVRASALALLEADDYDPGSEALKKFEERGTYLDGQIERVVKQLESQSAADALDGRFAKATATRTQKREQLPAQRSWGETFVQSEEFRDYRFRGTSSRLDVDSVQTRALPTGIAELVASGMTIPKYVVNTSPPPAPTPLMDNVTQIEVSGNAIEYVAWTKKAGGAAKVAEKAAKPSAEFGPTVTSATLDNFAAYTQLTRQLIEDFSAVRSLIDTELVREVRRAVEADAAAVLAAASASIPDAVKAGDLLGAIRVGIGTVQAAGFTPTAVLLNPADWATLDIAVLAATDTGPRVNQSFWGLTPMASTAQTAGTAVVGDFRSAIHHYYRSQVNLYITDSHDVTFLANVFTLLAEQRGKTAVVRPTALVEAKTA